MGTSSGISPPFGRLSRAGGQITHALLTRSPLYSSRCRDFLARLACVRHAASVRSEPGSNSPKRNIRGDSLDTSCPLPSHLLWLTSSALKSVATIFHCQRAHIETKRLRCSSKHLTHNIEQSTQPVNSVESLFGPFFITRATKPVKCFFAV